ncbi:sugar phosphate isomerase/epimerase family protein [Candidatus Bipolaricaulota sp. J31]
MSLGIRAVEVPLTATGDFERELVDAALSRGLHITFHLHLGRRTICGWLDGRGRHVVPEGLWGLLDELAEQQGTPVLAVFHPFDDGRERERSLTITSLLCARLAEEADARGSQVIWAIENMPYDPDVPSRVGISFAELEGVIGEAPRLGICWDMGHWYLSQEQGGLPEEIRSLTRSVGHVIHTHVHDWSPELGDHLPPGRGNLPFAQAFRILRRAGYRGRLVLELDRERALRFGAPREEVRRALAAIRKAWTDEEEG